MARAAAVESADSSGVKGRTLVTTTTRSATPSSRNVRPSTSSLVPYAAAVSKQFTPPSTAAATIASASRYPGCPVRFATPYGIPNCTVPSISRDNS